MLGSNLPVRDSGVEEKSNCRRRWPRQRGRSAAILGWVVDLLNDLRYSITFEQENRMADIIVG